MNVLLWVCYYCEKLILIKDISVLRIFIFKLNLLFPFDIPKLVDTQGGGWWRRDTSYTCIWHSTDVRAEWPPFQHCQIYDNYILPPFFNKKYMNDPIFLDSYVKGLTFLTSWYMHIFAQIFFQGCLFSLGIQWLNCNICLTTSNKWVQKIKGQHRNRSTFRMIKYMNGSVFSKARYMNGVGFEILARTPVPQLPWLPPPHPTHIHTHLI